MPTLSACLTFFTSSHTFNIIQTIRDQASHAECANTPHGSNPTLESAVTGCEPLYISCGLLASVDSAALLRHASVWVYLFLAFGQAV